MRDKFQSSRNTCVCFIRAPCCWRIFTCAPSSSSPLTPSLPGLPGTRPPQHSPACTLKRKLHTQEEKPVAAASMSHIGAGVKRILQKWLCLLSAALNLLHKCVQDIHSRAIPRWGFYGEIKAKPGRLSPTRLTFQVGAWCWLQPLIEDTLETSAAAKWALNDPAILVQEGPPVAAPGPTETLTVWSTCQMWWRTSTSDWAEFPGSHSHTYTYINSLIVVKGVTQGGQRSAAVC